MNIDWDRKVEAGTISDSLSLLRKSPIDLNIGLESIVEVAGNRPKTEKEQLDRLTDALGSKTNAAAAGPVADAAQKVIEGARTGLAKLNQGETAENFTLAEHMGLESVIIADGTRPSLFVKDRFVDLKSPDIGDWAMGLSRFRGAIEKLTSSVGRIDIPMTPWFIGTCFAIAPGLVITNRHVLEDIAKQDATGAWTLNWPTATTVDFNGEDGATSGTHFRIVSVAFAGPDPINDTINFAHLDAAILRVDPASDAANPFPATVTFEKDATQPQADRTLYVLGFPGKPRVWTIDGSPPTGWETTDVLTTLFNDSFGVKRLGPGKIKAGPGGVPNDGKQWICSHDASTLGGNSGSCVVDLGFDGFRIIGLHFGGANRSQNWAHVVSRLHDDLAEFAATFVV